MSIAHASSTVTLPVPPPVEGRTSLARNAPDEGDSDGASKRTDMLLRGAIEDPRVKMCTQIEGTESVGEGKVCVGGSYLHNSTVQSLYLLFRQWYLRRATYRTHITHTPYPRTGTLSLANTPLENLSSPLPLLVVHSGKTTTALPLAFASFRICSSVRAPVVGRPYEAGVYPVRTIKRSRGTVWNPESGVGGTESVLRAADPVPVCLPVVGASAGALEGLGATGRTKIGSKLLRSRRWKAKAEVEDENKDDAHGG